MLDITEEQVMQAAKGGNCFTESGKRVGVHLTPDELLLLEQTVALGYLEAAKGSQRSLNIVWEHLCKARKQPHVTLTPQPSYTRVTADLLPANLQLTRHGATLVNALANRSPRHGARHGKRPGCKWIIFDVKPGHVEDATAAAKELVTILQDPTAVTAGGRT